MPKWAYKPRKGVVLRDGVPVGTRNCAGYLVVRYEGRLVYVHRLAYFLKVGVWPVRIDHKNRQRADNRWNNLRVVTSEQNAQNMSLRPLCGAHFHKPSGLYKSAVQVAGVAHHLGYFKTAAAASAAYRRAKRAVHPYWSDHA